MSRFNSWVFISMFSEFFLCETDEELEEIVLEEDDDDEDDEEWVV